jgi:hypothetical protein
MNGPNAMLRNLTDKLGHLIELSRIIDRNRDDNAFAETGGEIIYVFDTNVVQMFLEPYKNPHFCQVFHTPLWGEDWEMDREVNAQACLLTAEYLMSGSLPGQKDPRWYMTSAHKAELDKQTAHLHGHIQDNVKRMRNEPSFKEDVLSDLARLSEALDMNPTEGRETFLARAQKTGLRQIWLDELRSLTDKQFRERAGGLRSREVCRVLSREDVAEPANQLFRYRRGPIAGQFMELEALLKPTREQRAEIDVEVDEWRARLAEVMARRPTNLKSRDGFRADCKALGLISWAGRQPKHHRIRFVLVTGDEVLLEAYRTEHVLNPVLRPYLLRPIVHYAPLFNPVSAHSILASQQYAFIKLQQVLEFLLVSLNIQLLIDAMPETRLRARDAFVLEVQQRQAEARASVSAAFPQSDDPMWLRAKLNDLDRLIQELRPIERLMLEAFPNLVAPRLKEERVSFEKARNDGGEVLLAEIERLLSAASEIGSHFSLQTTPDAIVRFFVSLKEKMPREQRATVYVRLSFGVQSGEASYESTVERLAGLDATALRKEVEALKGEPAKIFALAALLAFRLEIWKEAARYSDLAATASLEQNKYIEKLEVAPAEHYEYSYLMAAALRFRLASFEPSASYPFSDPWGEWLAFANAALADCIAYHSKNGQLSRLMRARSEQAAVNVSYCEWMAFGTLGKAILEPVADVSAAFKKVVTSLRDCEDDLAAADAHAVAIDDGNAEAPSQSLLNAVRRQFRTNVLAAHLVARRLKEMWPDLSPAIEPLAGILPEPRYETDWTNPPTIARIYSAAMRGDAVELEACDPDVLTLALDRVVWVGLTRMIKRGAGHS